MLRGRLEPFHTSVVSLIVHANTEELTLIAHIMRTTMIPGSALESVKHAWHARCKEIGFRSEQPPWPNADAKPFHKSILPILLRTKKEDVRVLASLLHTTVIPDKFREPIKHAWTAYCRRTGCDDYDVSRHLS